MLTKSNIGYRKLDDGTVQYSTYDLAEVRKIQRIASPHPNGYCCEDRFQNSSKMKLFLEKLRENNVTGRIARQGNGILKVMWNRKDDAVIDLIAQEIEIVCLEEAKEKHEYCN